MTRIGRIFTDFFIRAIRVLLLLRFLRECRKLIRCNLKISYLFFMSFAFLAVRSKPVHALNTDSAANIQEAMELSIESFGEDFAGRDIRAFLDNS